MNIDIYIYIVSDTGLLELKVNERLPAKLGWVPIVPSKDLRHNRTPQMRKPTTCGRTNILGNIG